jgi:hypothetical protein
MERTKGEGIEILFLLCLLFQNTCNTILGAQEPLQHLERIQTMNDRLLFSVQLSSLGFYMPDVVFENGIPNTCYDCLDLFLDIGDEALNCDLVKCKIRNSEDERE